MPSLTHEALLELFRDCPRLAPELLRAAGVEVPEYDEIRADSGDFTQLVPTQFLADLVVLLVRGKPVLAIVLEAQLSVKEKKLRRWPLYVAAASARFDCPACLVVVTPSAAVAKWAQSPIHIGPGATLQPIVLGPSAIPVVEDEEAARKDPELAVLSAVAHAQETDVEASAKRAFAALVGCLSLDDERGLRYADVVRALLSGAARKALEAIMESPQHREFQSEFARKYTALGKVEGKAEGKAEGRAEGKAEGRAEAVLRVLERRGIALTAEQRETILHATDIETLDRWLDRALVATSAQDVFA